MADRGEIRDAFYTELAALAGDYDVTDAGGSVLRTITLDADDIGLLEPEAEESFPSIVYDDSYVRVEHNGVGNGPEKTVVDNTGTVTKEIWKEYVEAQFTVFVRAANDLDKEPIYEALRRRFQQYRYGPWNLSDIHTDARDIEVLDAGSADTGDAERVIRGDELSIFIEFFREYELEDDEIQTVEHESDADTDSGTSGITFTTS